MTYAPSGPRSSRFRFNSSCFSSPSLPLGRIDDGNWRGWPEDQFGSVAAVMVSSKPRICPRQGLEHRPKQWVCLRVRFGAKLGSPGSVLVANRHLVGRNSHEDAEILARTRSGQPVLTHQFKYPRE